MHANEIPIKYDDIYIANSVSNMKTMLIWVYFIGM